jgi:hypothetical protein
LADRNPLFDGREKIKHRILLVEDDEVVEDEH